MARQAAISGISIDSNRQSKANTAKARTTMKKAKEAQHPPAEAWRIFRFLQRFELPKDMKACRRSGLEFTKDYVGLAAGDEAVGYQMQFQLLQNGDGFENMALYGLYRNLVNLAGQHSRAKRGYLIGADGQPLTNAHLARLFHIHPARMAKCLRRYAEVGLLERVALPAAWDLSQNEQPRDKGRGVPGQLPESGGQLPESGGQLPESGDVTKTSKSRKKKKAPSRTGKTGNGNPNPKGSNDPKSKAKAQRGTTGKTGTPNSANPVTAQGATSEAPKGEKQGQQQGRPTRNPTIPDASGRPETVQPGPKAARGSVNSATGRRRPRAPTPDAVVPVYDRFDLQLAQRVYLALKLPYATDSTEGVSEIASFAAVWHTIAEARASPEALDALGQRALREARRIGKAKTAQNRSAVWISTIRKIAAAKP
jgi:hypothetical protein